MRQRKQVQARKCGALVHVGFNYGVRVWGWGGNGVTSAAKCKGKTGGTEGWASFWVWEGQAT